MRDNKFQKIAFWLLSLLFLLSDGYIFAQNLLEIEYLGYVMLWDGLETKNNWSIASEDKQDRLDLSGEYKTEGETSLKVRVKSEIDRDLAEGIVVKREKAFLNIESAKSVILDIFNSGEPFNLVLVLHADGFHKSFSKRIEKGLNENIIFELKARNFSPPLRPDAIAQNLWFIIYPEEDTLDPVYFDNIRIHLYGGTELTPGIPSGAGEMVAEGYTPPEAPPVEHLYALPGWTTGEEPPPFIIYEPKTLFLLGIGLVGLVFCRKYK